MRDKIVSSILVFILLVNISVNCIVAEDKPSDMIEAYTETISLKSEWKGFPIEAFDVNVWNAYNILVLEIDDSLSFPDNLSTIIKPDGTANNMHKDVNFGSKSEEYRYLGYTPNGDLVNNPMYDDDHVGVMSIDTYDWQSNAEDNTRLVKYASTTEEQDEYVAEIFKALEAEYGDRFDDTQDTQAWIDNAIVILPATSKSGGVIKYMHLWDHDHDGVKDNWYITVNLSRKDTWGGGSSIVGGEVIGTTPVTVIGDIILGDNRIASNKRGEEVFDVTEGIPVMEEVYANVLASQYLHEESYSKIEGKVTYKVTVEKTYNKYKWNSTLYSQDKNLDGDTLDPGEVWGGYESTSDTVKQTYDVIRDYSFYIIDDVVIHGLDSAKLNSELLPDGQLVLDSSVDVPVVEMNKDESIESHYTLPLNGSNHTVKTSETIGKSKTNTSYPSTPDEDLSSIAQAAVAAVKVKNDSLIFNGVTILDGGEYDGDAPEPIAIPDAPMNGLNDLYEVGLTIPSTLTNGVKGSTGTLTYEVVYGTGSSKEVAITGLNDVVIHTPVVCYPELDAISRETQLSDFDDSDMQLVIEETFHLDYPTEGYHSSMAGYGDRDYAEYLDVKQVRFPFDVYVGEGYDGLFLPKGTWGNFNSLENTFFVPSWVEEGGGHILFRSMAVNIPDYDHDAYNYNSNTSVDAYKAVEAIGCNISGKVSKLTVVNCPDDVWKNNFAVDEVTGDSHVMAVGETADNMAEVIAGNSGYADVDENLLLPLLPGKTYVKDGVNIEYDGVMLGYPIEFSVETNGDMADSDDFVYIKPEFYYVEEVGGVPDMSTRIDVDLYVSEFGSLKAYDTSVLLTEDERSLVGDSAEKSGSISISDKERSVQQWMGEFYLPNMTYAVPAGTDLSSYSKINLSDEPFLHDGYIIVNFGVDIYNGLAMSDDDKLRFSSVKKDYDVVVDLDDYMTGHDEYMTYGVSWSHEGYDTTQFGLQLLEGDVMFYSTDRRASQTYY